MDNITHTLIGALVGTRAAAGLKQSRNAVVVSSILANSFPDADIVYASFLSGDFGYLLHHRGHTHTVPGALGCGVVVWILVWGFSIARRSPLSRDASLLVGAVSFLGAILHLLLDSLNTYGTHPFWPLNNDWIYGDTLFIVEPTLWITMAFALCTSVSSRWVRCAAGTLAAAAMGLIVLSNRVPALVFTPFLIILALMLLASRFFSRRLMFRAWCFASAAVFTCFFVNGRLAAKELRPTSSGEEMLVSFVSPSPANPFCWSFLQMVQSESEIAYLRGFIQPWRSAFRLDCGRYAAADHSVPQPPDFERTAVPRRSLAALADNCRWQAFLRFARAPGLASCMDGAVCLTDLRFSRLGRRSFATMPLDGICPGDLPPWNPPVRFREPKN